MTPPQDSAPKPPTPPVIEVEGLRVAFRLPGGEVEAVRGVDFTLRRGRVLAIVGESGCGKSVTCQALLRLIQPPGRISAGSITISPREGPPLDVASLAESDPRLRRLRGGVVAMIFQEPMASLSPVHTVGFQVAEPLRLHRGLGRREALEAAAEALSAVGIPRAADRLHRYPHEFSGGMRQRAAIAMALAARPEVVLADEPTTALDVTLQAQILALLRTRQRDEGLSVIFITHDLGAVAQVADEVAVMYLGRIVELGSVRDVLRSPAHPYTRALLASLPRRNPPGAPHPTQPRPRPSLRATIPGCPFHPRCSHATPGTCGVGTPPTLAPSPHGGPGQLDACSRRSELPPGP